MSCGGFDVPNLLLNLISVWLIWLTWKCAGKISRHMKWWEENFTVPKDPPDEQA